MAKKRATTKQILIEEKRIEELGRSELKELKKLEQDIKKTQAPHPLTKITYKDVIRGSIGALFGTVGHFAFFYGAELAETISMQRATFLYLLSLLVCFLFMYYSGFRKVKEIKVMHFIPIRVAVVYVVALVVIFITLFVFGFINLTSSFTHIYKTIATNSLLAVLGASTADILGKD